jgi:hypothetical protein
VIPRTGSECTLGGIGLTPRIRSVLVAKEFSSIGRARCDGRPLVDDDMNGSDPGGPGVISRRGERKELSRHKGT